MASSSRAILPRLDGSGGGGEGGEDGGDAMQPNKLQKRKRAQVAAACERCRSRKHRCDGARPTCTPCKSKDMPCTYRLPAGETHDSYRRRQVEQLHTNAVELERVVKLIRESSDEVSREMVRHLKDSPSLEDAVSLILNARPGPQIAHGAHEASIQQQQQQQQQQQPASSSSGIVSPSAVSGSPHRDPGADGGASGHDAGFGVALDPLRMDTPAAGPHCMHWHWLLRPVARQPHEDAMVEDDDGKEYSVSSASSAEFSPDGEELLTTLPFRLMHQYRQLASTQPGGQEQQQQQQQQQSRLSYGSRLTAESQALTNLVSLFSFDGSPQSLGNLPPSSAIRANNYPADIQRRQLLHFQVPEHGFLPLSTESDESPMATMPAAFRHAALDVIDSGRASVDSVIGSHDPAFGGRPVFVDLFFQDKDAVGAQLNVCDFVCELFKGLSLEVDRYILLASIAAVVRYMRWSILPSQSNYRAMPESMRPLPSQRLVPHSPAIDVCPHPGVREALIRKYRDWITPATGAARPRIWPFGLADAVEVDRMTGRTRLTSKFESWSADPNNWTLDPNVHSNVPGIEDFGLVLRDE